MKKTIDPCLGCTTDSLPCKGRSCPNFYPYDTLICDLCLVEAERLFVFEGNEICEECLLENFQEVTLED